MQPATASPTYALASKPDAAATFARFEAWWDGRLLDRAPVSIGLRDERPRNWPAPRPWADERARWHDFEHRLASLAAWVDGVEFPADNLPGCMPNLGPDVLATLYGAGLEFSPSTSWSKPVAGDCRRVLALQPDLACAEWTWIRKATDLSLQVGAGRWLTQVTDLHSNGDLLAALRDPQHLLEEMALDPEAVELAMRHVTPLFATTYDDLADRIRARGQPVMSWLQAPSFRRTCVLQCDLICMMSPRMFKCFILPALQAEMAHVERSIFHLDGPQALIHLDALLACPELHAIQWVYGAGHGPARKWIDVYRRIQAAGKAMQICCEDLEDARAVMQAIGPKGALFQVGGAYDRATIDAFLEEVRVWTDRGR